MTGVPERNGDRWWFRLRDRRHYRPSSGTITGDWFSGVAQQRVPSAAAGALAVDPPCAGHAAIETDLPSVVHPALAASLPCETARDRITANQLGGVMR